MDPRASCRVPGGICLAALLLAGCADLAPQPRAPSTGHLGAEEPAPPAANIPPPVRQTPFLPEPKPAPPLETYTVVVSEVPVKELLFALARDAAVNVDIHPSIEGTVTLNAVNQTLPQIMERLSRQLDVRYEMEGENLVVSPDLPFLKTYRVDYVNMSRDSSMSVKLSTQVVTSGAETSGGGRSDSKAEVTNTSNHRFWETLENNIAAMIGAKKADRDQAVISNRESGLVVVRATARQHEQIRAYLDQVLVNAKRQVLIEASIVEVELSDKYQAGIDWVHLANSTGAGLIAAQTVLGGFTEPAAGVGGLLLDYQDAGTGSPKHDITLTVRMLKEFGNTRVLSSPKVMALNNQTAVIKVVDNRIYFTASSDISQTESSTIQTFETTPHTVPVGIVLNVTPQIDYRDDVTLNIRPTISRILRFVEDPNPALELTSLIPEIQTREMESVLKVRSGQIAVLGGLMQDDVRGDNQGLPFLSDLDHVGDLFQFRSEEFFKSELVIFLRATVVRDASVDSDLVQFRSLLPVNLPAERPQPSRGLAAEATGGETQ